MEMVWGRRILLMGHSFLWMLSTAPRTLRKVKPGRLPEPGGPDVATHAE